MNATILHLRFVLEIKEHEEENEYYKARLVIIQHIVSENLRVEYDASTMLNLSIRLDLTLSAL